MLRKVYFSFILIKQKCFVGEISSADEKAKMNINNATIKELSTLEKKKKKKAQSIINYRQKNDSFMKIEDLKSVKGIGNKIFEKIKDQIAVE